MGKGIEMQEKPASLILLFLLLVSALVLAFNVQPVKSDYAWTQTIYINADGSIQPSTAPISTVDNVTYTLTDNIVGNVFNLTAITIHRNNIIIDGAGRTLNGNSVYYPSEGIESDGSNVTIKNMNITAFSTGIYLSPYSSYSNISGNDITASDWIGIDIYSSNDSVSGNNMTNNFYGIYLESSSGNDSVSGNNITANNQDGIYICSSNDSVSGNNITTSVGEAIYICSSNDSVSGNNITANYQTGVYLTSSSGNDSVSGNNITANNQDGIDIRSSNDSVSGNNITANGGPGIFLSFSGDNPPSSFNDSVSGNNVTNNWIGIVIHSAFNNTIYHNDFVNNTLSQVISDGSPNVWDDGYPSGGNYWSDYNGTDLFRRADQNVTGSDGIGDTPYIIDANNTDHYPLMGPFSATVNTGSNVAVYPSQDVKLIFSKVTAAGAVALKETLTVPAPNPDLVGPYYVITVTASFSGNVTVIVAFDGSNMTQQQKGNLTMVQYTPIPGDIQPAFGQVDMRDIGYIARRFGINATSPLWDPAADITGPTPGVPDGKIDMRDIGLAAKNFGKTANWVNITTYVDTVNNVIYGNTTHFSLIAIH